MFIERTSDEGLKITGEARAHVEDLILSKGYGLDDGGRSSAVGA